MPYSPTIDWLMIDKTLMERTVRAGAATAITLVASWMSFQSDGRSGWDRSAASGMLVSSPTDRIM